MLMSDWEKIKILDTGNGMLLGSLFWYSAVHFQIYYFSASLSLCMFLKLEIDRQEMLHQLLVN